MKIKCKKCLKEKEEIEFYKEKRNKSGRFSTCILCCHIYDQKKYQSKHKNKHNRGPGCFERSQNKEKDIYWCSSCRVWKKGPEFYNSKTNTYGKANQCISCRKRYCQNPKTRVRRKKYLSTYSKSPKGKYSTYKGGAKTRKIEFKLTRKEFELFWKQPCYYCGDSIETIGIDRKDNNIGYILENCVPCCHTCNFDFKRGYSDRDFLAHIYKIAKKHFM